MHWMARHRLVVIALLCVVCTGGVSLGHLFSGLPFLSGIWTSEQTFEDFVQREGRKTATRPDFVFLGIDQSTLELPPFLPEEIADNRALQLMTERPFPWSREVWAIMLDQLFAAGARLVIFDLIFSPPNDGDPAFRAALDRHRERVVLGGNFDFSAVDQGGGGGFAQNIPPNPALIPAPAMYDDRVGYVAMFPDPIDGKIRAVRYTITDLQLAFQPARQGEVPYAALSARALEKMGAGDRVPRDLQAHLIRFSDPNAYQPLPLWQIFDRKFWRLNFGDGAFFKDKVVMIGSSAQIAHDVFPTPMGPETPGPLLHVNAVAAALDGEFLRVTSARANWWMVGGAGTLAGLLVGFVRRPLITVVLLLGVAAAYLGLARLCYDQTGLLLLVVPVLVAFLLSGSLALGFDYALERMEKLRTRRTLERYVSKNLVKDILDNPASFYSTMKGARIPVTVLFTDLIGFTTLSERANPEELVRQLNEYLSKMVSVVFANQGTLDKFIGDAIMAVWGNVQSSGPVKDAKECARAALGMRSALKELNEGWRKEGRMTLGMGVGLNSGDVLAGNIGSGERADLTVIGDAVNLASRLEALTRTYGVDLLVGEATAELIRDEFHLRSVARVQVKGKTIPVTVSTLLCEKGAPYDADFLKQVETYEEGIVKFRGREFTEAKTLFERFLEFYPNDYLAKMYFDRALEYENAPPDESWTAAEVFTKK
ncbi:MAG: adenylate/guanylate cyclase domain-containing protein [Chthoniobacterales bacterium]